jgi:hypothetical protein
MPNYTVAKEFFLNTIHRMPGDTVTLTQAQADSLFAGGALVDANAPAPVPANLPRGYVDAAGYHSGDDACVNTFHLEAGRLYGPADILDWLTRYTDAQLYGFFVTLQAAHCIGAVGAGLP